jgi:hypothetical protein
MQNSYIAETALKNIYQDLEAKKCYQEICLAMNVRYILDLYSMEFYE